MDRFLPDSVLRRNRALRDLMALGRTVVADGEVSGEEARKLEEWLDEHPDMLGIASLNRIRPILRSIYGDGEVSPRDRKELAAILTELSGEAGEHDEEWGRLHRSEE